MQYEIGDKIKVATVDGIVVVEVTDQDDDIKNGEPGWEGILQGDSGQMLWGYDAQILDVL